MVDCLFVYGTLMRSASASALGRDMRAGLERAGIWRGPATIAGRLYALAQYPILKAPIDSGDVVHGEVYRLRDPDAVFQWLDPYEGIEPTGKGRGEYERVARSVVLSAGERLQAWVYVSSLEVAGSRHVPSGRWVPTVPSSDLGREQR